MTEIILDTETTGLSSSTDKIIEIACIELDNHTPTGKKFHTFINPEMNITDGAYQTHGITRDFLNDKPKFKEVAKEFLDFIRDLQNEIRRINLKEFINKTGEFTVNIALINNKSTVFGIVAAPVSGKIWYGSVLDKKHEVDSVPETIRIVMSKSHKNENDEKFLEFLDMNNVQYQTVEKGSSLKLCSLADNEADIYSRFGPTSEWDIAAAHAVLNSCGGSVINIKEEIELDYAKKSTILNPYFMAFRNKALENEFLDLLRDFFKKLV